jgi:nucleotide-binding universal stress UspA family protein
MIKDLVVNLRPQDARDPARDFAISIANAFGAHVAGIAFALVPELPGFIAPMLRPDILAEVGSSIEAAAQAAIDRFDAAAGQGQLSREHRMIQATEAGGPRILAALARRFDLSVFMQSEPNVVDNDALIETSLFQSGRPLVVVPYIQKEGLRLDRLVCCWDGSRAATRAINDALPLLVKAAAVDLLIVLNEKTRGGENEIRGDEMARHLARYDIRVQIETTRAEDIDVGNAILSYVADRSASLIVMGGYGHSRLRELILGGVTRAMLKSMTVPVFMSH